jgi:hypothetical protein
LQFTGIQIHFSDLEVSQAVPTSPSVRDRTERQSREVGSEEGEVIGFGIFMSKGKKSRMGFAAYD